MELKIEKERVLEAAETCYDVEKALKILFPEVFEGDNRYFDLRKLAIGEKDLLFDLEKSKKAGFQNNCFMQVRSSGQYENIAFFLHHDYNWELNEISRNGTCLIPTRKRIKL